MAKVLAPLSKDAFELVKSRYPNIQQPHDAIQWILQTKTDPYFLHTCLEKKVFNNILDWKRFITGLTALKLNPYIKHDLGEDPNNYLTIRDIVASCLTQEERAQLQSSLSTKRYSFATWALWNAPSNKGRMYLPVSSIVIYCNRLHLDFDEFYKHLRKHVGGAKGVMISADLFDAEVKIQNFLAGAQVLGATPINYDDLDNLQNDIITNMLNSPFAALQGGAGVGKTTTMGKLISTLVASSINVYCLAFTHKAKRCIINKLQSSGLANNPLVRVSTIHSFIASSTNNQSQIPPSYILIDESSMLDIELLATLANVVNGKFKYQLGFSGDMMQLPPITRGEFFRQLVTTKGLHVNELYKCYRTDRLDLFMSYQDVRNGVLPESSNNFTLIQVASDTDTNSYLGKMIHKDPKQFLESTVIIAWQNKDVFKINRWVQSALLKKRIIGPEVFKEFYKGDKVVYRGENTKTLTNATIGYVVDVVSKSITVKWEDNTTNVCNSDLIKNISLAYALTVHCVQGSECDKVVVVCYEVDKMKFCLDRRFIYTGVSRGKENVTVITTPNISDFLNTSVRSMPISSILIPDIKIDSCE